MLALWFTGAGYTNLIFFSVIENGLLELFPQYYTHGEEIILREEIQAILHRRNGCQEGKTPDVYHDPFLRDPFIRDVLVECRMLVSFLSCVNAEVTLLVPLQH